jgi:hypothetical protein
VGAQYYAFRAELMKRTEKGLTKTYNDFHDPDEAGADIVKLRDLHAEMDRAVLDAYGWTDIQPTNTFRLEFEDEDEDDGRRRKKAWRYGWPDELRDEVLARLLELNASRPKKNDGSPPPEVPPDDLVPDGDAKPSGSGQGSRTRKKSPKGQTSMF